MIIGHNLTALQAISRKAEEFGYRPLLISSRISGETRTVAQVFSAMLRDIAASHRTQQPVCVIAGGEMTVQVRGKGRGGRNQDFCLAMIPMIKSFDRVVILSAGTDGTDGPTNAAGAMVDNTTLSRALKTGLNIDQALAEYDSYGFFKRSGDLLITGPTGTNVMDIQLALLHGVRSLH
jgi:glycerate-2-kinase